MFKKTISNNYILWIGALYTNKEIKKYKAVSIAANKWQKSLIFSLRKKNNKIITLGHTPEPLWPKGCFKVQGSNIEESNNEGYKLAYYNIPFIRNYILAFGYIVNALRIIKNYGKPKIILLYNVYPFSVALCNFFKKLYGIPWVAIVADAPTKRSYRLMSKHNNDLVNANGAVFLSWSYYNKLKKQIKSIHFEGEIEYNDEKIKIHNKNTSDLFNIMYSGSRGMHTGFEVLIDAIKYISNPNVRLWVTGGSNKKYDNYIDNENKIIDFGFLDDNELDNKMKLADAFISPYEINYEPNQYNFPSKILTYLSYGKPVLSTWTPGLSPEYEKVIYKISESNPISIAEKIDEIASMSLDLKVKYNNQVRNFLQNEKNIEHQIDSLTQWLDNVCETNS